MRFFDYGQALGLTLIILLSLLVESYCSIKLVNSYSPLINGKASKSWSWSSAGGHAALIKS